MKAVCTVNELRPVMKMGEAMAVTSHVKEEVYQFVELEKLSERLAAILVWSLESTVGPLQSIVVN